MKIYSVQNNIGKARHIVNFYDGIKTHADGSRFFNMRIFTNKRASDKFVNQLKEEDFKMG